MDPLTTSSSPFDSVAQRIRVELREAIRHEVEAYQWIESENGRSLSLQQAWFEWNDAHRKDLGQLLMVRLSGSTTSRR